MSRGIIALDADGVLLDYNLAYASAWERTFGNYPKEKDPHAYWAIDRWEVQRLSGEHLDQLRARFDESFWASVPAVSGAVQACCDLREAGFELVCVTALPERFASARQSNLHKLGFPIDRVIATDNVANGQSPKAAALHELKPVAFVDDYLPYMVGVHADIHSALIMRAINGSPNSGEHMKAAASTHASLLEFSGWWLRGQEEI
jgi:phosphoglycolate phosphatase-like HAD superfamily hydrolase